MPNEEKCQKAVRHRLAVLLNNACMYLRVESLMSH